MVQRRAPPAGTSFIATPGSAIRLDSSSESSYIDGVVLRQKEDNSERWTSAADGTLDRRIYYCQNWRSDVVALVGAGGKMKEWVKYTSYGVAMALPAGDTDSDFDCDATDISNIDNWPGGYDVRSDLDLDGTLHPGRRRLFLVSFAL